MNISEQIGDPEQALQAIRNERARRMRGSLSRYVTQGAFNVLHPSVPLQWNWHHERICDALERVTAGQLKRLYINAPPGSMKSLLLNVFWPTWEWTHSPDTQWLTASHSGKLTKRDCMRARDLVRSEWHRAYFDVTIRNDRDGKTDFGNTDRGFYVATSVTSGQTGLRADRLNVDDPIDVDEAYSEVKRVRALNWFADKFADRLNSDDSTIVVIGQRVHDDDLFAFLENLGSYESIVLTDPYDPAYQSQCCTLDIDDPRAPGDYLHAERHGKQHHDEQRELKGPSIYHAHFGQHPTQPGGEVLRGDWLSHRYTETPEALLKRVTEENRNTKLIWVLDPKAGSTDQQSSEADLQLWLGVGKDEHNRPERAYLLDERRGRWNQPDTLRKLKTLYTDPLWGRADRVLIESEADGPSLEANLTPDPKFPIPITLVKPWASKRQRTEDVSGYWEAGLAWLPTAKMPGYEWIDGWIEQHTKFPKAAHDDRVDTSTYALYYFFRLPLDTGPTDWHAGGESRYEQHNDEPDTIGGTPGTSSEWSAGSDGGDGAPSSLDGELSQFYNEG